MSTQLVQNTITPLHTIQNQMPQDKIDLLKRTVCEGASNDELELFLAQCTRTGLDPFARQIYSIGRGGKRSIQISIDGFRLIAERTGKYGGQTPRQWCGPDGKWVDVWLHDASPVAARVGVIRKDFVEPLYAVATMREYRQQSPTWTKMAASMLAKCAESLALRMAFPQELSGLYGSEEMGQTDQVPEMIEAELHDPKPEPVKLGPGDMKRKAELNKQIAALSSQMAKEGVPEVTIRALKGYTDINSATIEELEGALDALENYTKDDDPSSDGIDSWGGYGTEADNDDLANAMYEEIHFGD